MNSRTKANGDLMRLDAISSAASVGQGTVIEQSRAMAEVYAAVALAQQFPRDEGYAERSMQNSCRQMYVAEKAFYRVQRAGGTATGESISLATELARCWGHIHYGVFELRRDDEGHESEMVAWAWDVQTGTRSAQGFIVPHKRDRTDKNSGAKFTVDLVTNQEIYENNANQGARRLRECILRVLPRWFVETAKDLCRKTEAAGDGTPIEDRIAKCVAAFAGIGVTEKQLVAKLELQRGQWTGHEVSQLGVIFRSIQNGEISRDVEFPPGEAVLTTKDIVGRGEPEKAAEPKPAPGAPPEPQPAEQHPTGESASQPEHTDAEGVPTEPPAEPDTPEPTTDEDPADGADQLPSSEGPKARRTQLDAIAKLLDDNGAKAREDKLAVLSLMLDQNIPAAGVLSADEATYVFTQLERKVAAGEFAGTLERARRIASGG